jgi:hypothetical protein
VIRLLFWLTALCVLGLPFGSDASAQAAGVNKPAAKGGKAGAAKGGKKSKRTAKAKTKTAPATADKPAEAVPAPEASAGRAPHVEDAAALAADADERVRKEGGSEIKTMEFGGLDIEGNLKTPQMLYFLNRLRAEFARPELPHRSFMPELQRGTKESAF